MKNRFIKYWYLTLLILGFFIVSITSFFSKNFILSLISVNYSMLIYQLAVGVREGYTWSIGKDKRVSVNPLICNTFKTGKGFLDYHSWRIMEDFSFLGTILGIFSLAKKNLHVLLLFLLLFGTYSLVYQIGLNRVLYKRVWLDMNKTKFYLCGITLPVFWFMPIFRMIVGLLIFLFYFVEPKISCCLLIPFLLIYAL